ncbi:MAG: hypothetical protein MUQ32_17145 [Chloroflexi bacterium]|nr:hypothetical protein [Chloroflexota bacterium]
MSLPKTAAVVPEPTAAVPEPPAPTPPAAVPPTTGWGTGSVPPPATPPPAGGAWGTQSQPPVQPAGGQWASPPPQAGGWGPPPGAAGGPPAGAWNPQPASSGNGCLKGCLIVGGVLVVLGILGIIGITFLGAQVADDMGMNLDGTTKTCDLISDGDLAQVLGPDAQALPIGGIADATIGQVVLDKRVISDAPDCWIFGASGASTTGRLARQDGGDASGDFSSARQSAQDEGYFDGDLDGLGDEAFCTGSSEFGSAGVLVRSGGRLVYVSLIDPTGYACDLAGEIAVQMLR